MIPVYYVRVKFGVNVLHLVLLAGVGQYHRSQHANNLR